VSELRGGKRQSTRRGTELTQHCTRADGSPDALKTPTKPAESAGCEASPSDDRAKTPLDGSQNEAQYTSKNREEIMVVKNPA